MRGITAISTKGMSRNDWLALRRHGIGGSDAAGVLGISEYTSPYSVWAEKTGRIPEKPDNEAMRIGRDLEEYVAKRWAEETGKRVRRENAILYNPAFPFAHANIDRIVIGERAGLECKTTSALDVKQFNGVDFPEKYYVQCVHYLAVTGFDRWYLAVLQFGRGFYTFTLERDEAEISALMDAEARFWKHVEDDTPPAVDGTDATAGALETIYRESSGKTVDLFGRGAMLGEYFALKRQRDGLNQRITEIENTIKNDMGEAERGETQGFSVSWKTQQRRSFQADAFSEDHPEIDLSPYYKATTSRPFKVKEVKDK